MQDQKTKAISEIVKIIEECRYNDELAEVYKREILDQEKLGTAQKIQKTFINFQQYLYQEIEA